MNDNLPIGAHLMTPRNWYEHHGIYVGEGRVVHYSGFCHGYHVGPVEEVTLADFECGRGFRIRVHGRGVFSGSQIAARARSRVGEEDYRLFANNCEHFCEWCVTGRSRSQQVDRLLSIPRIVAGRIAESRVFRAIHRSWKGLFQDENAVETRASPSETEAPVRRRDDQRRSPAAGVMKLVTKVAWSFEMLALLFTCFAGAVRASDPAQAVILVATPRLADSPLAETVLVAAPLSDGSHIGFVVSNPTGVTLSSLFPEQAAARRVVDSVFLGGPLLPQTLFAIARSPPAEKHGFVELIPAVFVVFEADAIDQIIETAPNDARYFLGLIVWQPGGLEDEIRDGSWQVRPAEARTVFTSQPKKLWKALYRESHGIEASIDPATPARPLLQRDDAIAAPLAAVGGFGYDDLPAMRKTTVISR